MSPKKPKGFDFERLVQTKLLALARPSHRLPYRGSSGVYSFLGYYFRLKRAESRKLLRSMRNRGMIRIGNRSIEILEP